MNINPKISVILSAYNAEKYVEKAVQSILNQTFTDFEFIIYNDGSTDSTQEILQKIASEDNRIQLVHKSQNNGFSGFINNVNEALKQAKGTYIARMDADDVAHETRLEKQFQFLERHPEFFLVGSSANHINEQGESIGKFEAKTYENELHKVLEDNNYIYNPTIMFRNEGNLYYREKCLGCEDYDFHLRLITEGKKLSNLPEILLDYRILQTSLSRGKNFFEKWIFKLEVQQFYRERLKNGNDSYEEFQPNDILQLLHPTIKSPRIYVYKAIVLAFRTKEWNILKKLIRKLL